MALKEVVKKRAVARAPGRSGVQLGEDSVRAAILQGAATVIAKRGVRATSVDDILGASGISRRTFYRFYQNKEDVLVALYHLGTEELLAACRRVVAEESDPVRQLEGCIDAHLGNAKELGRLMFVLGGEAHRHESPLHQRRMEVHGQLVSLLENTRAVQRGSAKRVDPLIYRGLLLSLEGVTRFVLEEGNEGRSVTAASIERARRVMMRIATAAILGDGTGVTKMPTQ
jgi:AcrR family transcriptional regulator